MCAFLFCFHNHNVLSTGYVQQSCGRVAAVIRYDSVVTVLNGVHTDIDHYIRNEVKRSKILDFCVLEINMTYGDQHGVFMVGFCLADICATALRFAALNFFAHRFAGVTSGRPDK